MCDSVSPAKALTVMHLFGLQTIGTHSIKSILLQTMRGWSRISRLNSVCSLPHIWAISAFGPHPNTARRQPGKV